MRIFIFLLAISFVACSQQPKEKEYVIKPEAKSLADSAYKLFMKKWRDTVNFRSAINLLKQATEIDSNYISAFRHILSYQLQFKDYGNALVTAKRMSALRPKNADFIAGVGMMYEFNNDTISSKPYFQKAVNIYTKLLDTLSDQNNIEQAKSGKALNLLFLNRYQEGQEILKDLINNSKDSALKEGIKEEYLNKTGRQIILMFLNNGKETKK